MNQLDPDSSVVLLSGGMDSTTLFYEAMVEHNVVAALSFDYGQRHVTELGYAERTAAKFNVEHQVISLRDVTKFLTGSALTDPGVEVPHGHYAEDNMRVTVVPNRNMMMLSIAAAIAIGLNAESVWAAMHAGDHPVYPDCRPGFISQLNTTLRFATETTVKVWTPYINIGKDEIVRIGARLGVPYEETWSCYEGGNVHCGRCGTCVERAEAFHLAGVSDPTLYQDPDYWKSAVGVDT